MIEIVTQPDFRSAEEVLIYLNKLKSMFRSGGISECEEGAMRCDVNISVRPEGSTEFGVRTEIKNMASFEAIEKAIRYEVQRHIDAIEFETEELVQETRRYDDASGKTFAMRNKETEADYRYFPDANLMPIIIDYIPPRDAAARGRCKESGVLRNGSAGHRSHWVHLP